jgi:hypothetical protein
LFFMVVEASQQVGGDLKFSARVPQGPATEVFDWDLSDVGDSHGFAGLDSQVEDLEFGAADTEWFRVPMG